MKKYIISIIGLLLLFSFCSKNKPEGSKQTKKQTEEQTEPKKKLTPEEQAELDKIWLSEHQSY